MPDPTTAGKGIGALAAMIVAAMKFTPATASRMLGTLLTVGAIYWLGVELVDQSKTNSERLVTTLETQTSQIIQAVREITEERAKEANIIKQILDGVGATKQDIQYLRGRMDQIETENKYHSVRMSK